MQYGVLVISTIRAGSQNPIDTPGTGTFALVHTHNGDFGFARSLFFGDIPLPIDNPPIEIGIKQLQQTSVTGLTKWPLQITPAFADNGIIKAISMIVVILLIRLFI
jgi:hypothetical protein